MIANSTAAQQTKTAALFQLMADRIPGVVWSTDTQLRLTSTWGAGLAALGLRPDQVVGKTLSEYFQTDDEDFPILAAHRRALQGDAADFDFCWTQRVYRVHVERLVEEAGAVVGCIGFAHDVTEQKQAEKALQESEERYRLLVEMIPQPVWRFSAEGELVDCTRRWSEYTGQSVEQAKGDGWMKVVHPDDLDYVLKRIQEAGDTGELYRAEHRLRRASDGSYRWHAARALPLKDKDGTITGWFGSATDIDDRKQAEDALKRAHDELEERVEQRTAELSRANEELRREIADHRHTQEALRESEQQYRAIVEDQTELIARFQPDYTLTFVNDAYCRYFGQARAALIGQSFMPLIDQRDRNAVQAYLAGLNRENPVVVVEERVSLPNGEMRWQQWIDRAIVDEHGQVVEFQAVGRDITERKEADDALRASEERFRSYFEQGLIGMAVASLEKQWLEVNDRLCKILGYSREELVTMRWTEATHPDDLQANLVPFHRLLAGEIDHFTMEKRFLRKDGGVVDTTVFIRRFRGRDGTADHILALIEDVTQRKQAERALQRERRTLQHMLRASDHERQLISYEIHDGLAQYLGSAIMQFQTYQHLQEKRHQDAAKAFDGAMTMLRQSHFEARRLISGVRPPILDESGVLAAIAHLIHDPGQDGGPRTELRSHVKFDRLPSVVENAIYRIVQEGLTNVGKHSKSARVRVSLLQHDDTLRIEIRDWGVGFDPKKMPENRFGLSGIRERARLLGGKCRIRSKPGQGTTIVVELPLVSNEDHASGST